MEKSPLSKLAAELRNQVFEYALTSAEDIVVKPKTDSYNDPPSYKPRYRLDTAVALTMTCRQIRRETLATFYWINTFYHCSKDPYAKDAPLTVLKSVSSWLHRIGSENPSWTRKITLDFGPFLTRASIDCFVASPALFKHHAIHTCDLRALLGPSHIGWVVNLPICDPQEPDKLGEAMTLLYEGADEVNNVEGMTIIDVITEAFIEELDEPRTVELEGLKLLTE